MVFFRFFPAGDRAEGWGWRLMDGAAVVAETKVVFSTKAACHESVTALKRSAAAAPVVDDPSHPDPVEAPKAEAGRPAGAAPAHGRRFGA